MKTSRLRCCAVLLSLAFVSTACGSDPSSDKRAEGLKEDVKACSGSFVCFSPGEAPIEYQLKIRQDTNCGVFNSDGVQELTLHPDGTFEGDTWHATVRGFVMIYSPTIKQTCVGKSSYIPGEEYEWDAPEEDEERDCRGSGRFCYSGSVCCSFSCDYYSKTCH